MGPTRIIWWYEPPWGTARHRADGDGDTATPTTSPHRNGETELMDENEPHEEQKEYGKEETSFGRRLKERTAAIITVEELDHETTQMVERRRF